MISLLAMNRLVICIYKMIVQGEIPAKCLSAHSVPKVP